METIPGRGPYGVSSSARRPDLISVSHATAARLGAPSPSASGRGSHPASAEPVDETPLLGLAGRSLSGSARSRWMGLPPFDQSCARFGGSVRTQSSVRLELAVVEQLVDGSVSGEDRDPLPIVL